jgi:hypothetical protein
MDDFAMLPNEPTNSGISGNGLIGSVFALIPGTDGLDGEIVDEWDGMVRDFVLKDEGSVSLKDLCGISKPLRESGETMRAQWGPERSKISGLRMEWTMIISTV